MVEQVRAEDKYFNHSRLEVANRLSDEDRIQIECDHDTSSEVGPEEIPLKLFVARRRKFWSAALMMHGICIDRVDWLPSYPCEDGTTGHGWHRHRWQPDELNCDVHVPLPDSFGDGLENVEDFLIRVSREMRITWSASDVGFDDYLPRS